MDRIKFFKQIQQGFLSHPVVALLGPRQCGKTTLARQFFATKSSRVATSNFFDLEDPIDLARLRNPKLALQDLSGLIVIDEIQRQPELFSLLRVLVDKEPLQQQFLILGSASRELIKQSSESLAGRICFLELTPFQAGELAGFEDLSKLWSRGGFPRAFLAGSDEESFFWRQNYIKTFLEQDIPALGINIPAQSLRRFWAMLAHSHGQIFNGSAIGASLGLSHVTTRKYLDILAATFMVRILSPWVASIAKRQVKSPKIYLRDSGVYHGLLQLKNSSEIERFISLGASWEGFALEQVINYLNVDPLDCYFWASAAGAELDLLICHGLDKIGFEFKYSDQPKIRKSMQIALQDLELKKLFVISPGRHNFLLQENIQAVGLATFLIAEQPWF